MRNYMTEEDDQKTTFSFFLIRMSDIVLSIFISVTLSACQQLFAARHARQPL